MVVDTSAFLAILSNEAERHAFVVEIGKTDRRFVSAGTLLETSIVIRARSGSEGLRDLRLFMSAAGFTVVPFDEVQAKVAVDAYVRFGKGFHPAGLNFGDCFSYALSRTLVEPLLFKGDDFAQTDVVPVVS